MKKNWYFLIAIIGIISLTACTKNNDNQLSHLSSEESGKKTIEMEVNENYDDTDPFVNARLFCVSEDVDVLDTEISFQMDAESGIVEIKDNKTDETLWSNTWHQSVDNDTITISLNNMLKENEYAIWFTGTKINHAMVKLTFQSDLVQEKERPSK